MFGVDTKLISSVRIEKVASLDGERRNSSLDLKRIAGSLNTAGVSAIISENPTAYLCNAAYWHISTDGAHRALNDCRMNRAVYEKLGEILPEKLKNADRCPRCGSILVKRHGRFGAFMGCTGYPGCTYTENIRH